MKLTTGKISIITISTILLIDQILKIWIKTHMALYEKTSVLGNWFYINFVENNGMAFGMEFGGDFGKLFLSIFRIVAVSGIAYYLYSTIKKGATTGFIICLSMILAGAIGNIIDSAFYGLIFSDSPEYMPHFKQVAQFLPESGGYAGFLHGKVVDMFWFPIIQGHYPSWIPFIGGSEYMFFRPVFNVADSAISVGIFIIIIFQKKFFPQADDKSTVSE